LDGVQTTQGLFLPSLVPTEVRVIVSTPLSIILWWKLEYQEKTTDFLQVKLSHNVA